MREVRKSDEASEPSRDGRDRRTSPLLLRGTAEETRSAAPTRFFG